MQDWLSAQAYARPDGIALIIDDVPYTYRQLNKQVAEVTARMTELAGLGRRRRIAVLMPNCLEAVLVIHAAARKGAELVMLNTRLTARELEAQLAQIPCVGLLCTRETAQLAASIRADLGWRASVHPLETPIPGLIAFNDAQFAPYDSWSGEIDLDALFAIMFTSGTSGTPKGAMLTLGQFYYNAMASAYRIGVIPDERWLCILPLYHVGGLSIVFRSCLYGTAVELWTKFDPEALNRALAEKPITLVSLVPTMLFRMLETRGNDQTPRALRLILLGGAAGTPDLLARAAAAGLPVSTTYGLTEAASQVVTMLPDEALRKPGSVGKPLLFTQIRIVDNEGRDLPTGERGEIAVKGPSVTMGYYGDPAATARTIRAEWLFTGDLGYLDADGDLWVVQRRSDLIITGGENVYPAEVEFVLRQHSGVSEVAVFGIESPEWEQEVAAAVVLRDTSVSETDLKTYCAAYLAKYKCPRHIAFVDVLPQTSSGKINRKALQGLIQKG